MTRATIRRNAGAIFSLEWPVAMVGQDSYGSPEIDTRGDLKYTVERELADAGGASVSESRSFGLTEVDGRLGFAFRFGQTFKSSASSASASFSTEIAVVGRNPNAGGFGYQFGRIPVPNATVVWTTGGILTLALASLAALAAA